MQIYKTKTFTKWQKKEVVNDNELYLAILEMESGLIDANLGKGLYKKRIAKPGFGKRSSYRTIVASKLDNQWFYMFGFSKNEKDNISERELLSLIEVSQQLFRLSDLEIKQLISEQKIFEVYHE